MTRSQSPKPPQTHPLRDPVAAALALFGISIYLLACVPGTIEFSPSERYFAYVAHDPAHPVHPRAMPADPKSEPPARLALNRLIIVDRKLGLSRVLLAERSLLPNPIFIDEKTLVVGEWTRGGEELHYLKVHRESGDISVMARFDLRSIPIEERNGFQMASGAIRSAVAGDRLVIGVPTQGGFRCLELSLSEGKAWLLPVDGGLPRLSPDGQRLLSYSGEQPLDFETRQAIDLKSRVSVDSLGSRSVAQAPAGQDPSKKDGSPQTIDPDANAYWIELYEFESGRRNRMRVIGIPQLNVHNIAGLRPMPTLDAAKRRVLVPNKKGGLLEINLATQARKVWFPESEVAVAAFSKDPRKLATLVINPSWLRLESWDLSSESRRVVIDRIDYEIAYSMSQYALSPDGEALVFVLEGDASKPGAVSVEVDLETGDPTVRVPTANDGLAVSSHFTQDTPTPFLARVIDEIHRQTKEHLKKDAGETSTPK